MFKRIGIKKRDTSGNELTEQLLGMAQGFSCQDNTELTTLSLGHPKDFSTREKKPLIQWEDLPHDVLFYMSSFLDFKSLVSLAHINKNADFLLDIDGERLNKLQKTLRLFYSRKYPRNAYANGKWKRYYSITYRIQWRLVWLLLDKKHEASFKTRLDFVNHCHAAQLLQHARALDSADNLRICCNCEWCCDAPNLDYTKKPRSVVICQKATILFAKSMYLSVILTAFGQLIYLVTVPKPANESDAGVYYYNGRSFTFSLMLSLFMMFCCCMPVSCLYFKSIRLRPLVNVINILERRSEHQPLLRQLLNDTQLTLTSDKNLQQLYDQMEQGESVPRGVTMV